MTSSIGLIEIALRKSTWDPHDEIHIQSGSNAFATCCRQFNAPTIELELRTGTGTGTGTGIEIGTGTSEFFLQLVEPTAQSVSNTQSLLADMFNDFFSLHAPLSRALFEEHRSLS